MEEVEEAGGEVTEEYLQHHCDQKDLSRVRELEIEVDAEEQHVDRIGEHLPNLVSLKLNGSKVSCVRELGVKFQKVRYMWLNRAGLQDLDGIVAALPVLEELYISFNEVRELSGLQFHETLQVVDLEGNQISDVNELENLASCPNLTELTIEENPIWKRHVGNLAEKVKELVPQVETLDAVPIEEKIQEIRDLGTSCSSSSSSSACVTDGAREPGGQVGRGVIRGGGGPAGVLLEEQDESAFGSSEQCRTRGNELGDAQHGCDGHHLSASVIKGIPRFTAEDEPPGRSGAEATPADHDDNYAAFSSATLSRKSSRPSSSNTNSGSIETRFPSSSSSSTGVPSGGGFLSSATDKMKTAYSDSTMSTHCDNSVFSGTDAEPDERELIVEAIKTTRQNFWNSRPNSTASSGSNRPLTSCSWSHYATSTMSNFGGGFGQKYSGLQGLLGAGQGSTSRPATSSTALPTDDRAGSAFSFSSSVLDGPASNNHSELTSGCNDVLVGSNPLKAIRQKRKNLGMKEHHTGAESIHHLLSKFQSYLQPSCLGESELQKRKKAFEDAGGFRPRTADVRVVGKTGGWDSTTDNSPGRRASGGGNRGSVHSRESERGRSGRSSANDLASVHESRTFGAGDAPDDPLAPGMPATKPTALTAHGEVLTLD
mmetsp:Transcript_4178/g.10182  ORF Transcript_4178/g.10182 Transcript_4178/m.10182 type:complete len:655 (-) Transcript_4178:291-2255(-)|eukprot:CAMPEP_0179000106 /NCGR_PEP_ID=MMETSP0795-20121207/10471_1 /TAXON_ID=88552 /ORGANISM="Amoebophrya sp., Strain Ameob2" /LENGTH=654 /DNA_ID=CAMNT_0020693033 /DNA_START=214 /DNA_END=2178 /DNA_ORIENTATION=+